MQIDRLQATLYKVNKAGAAGLLKNSFLRGLFKNVQVQGARNAAQRSRWAFFNSPAVYLLSSGSVIYD